MTPRDAFDDALDAAIDAVIGGASPQQVIATAPRHAGELHGLLQTAELLKTPPSVPRPLQTMSNYALLKAAVERAQIARQQMIPRDPDPQPSWWQRPLRFASLSVPAGIVAVLALAGVAGAAAGLATTNVGHEIADVMRPAFVSDLTGGGGGNDPGFGDDAHSANGSPGAPAGLEASGSSGDTPSAYNGPQFLEVTGNVSNVRGYVFTLTNSEGAWTVQIDSNTVVTGNIWEGGTATAAGDVTADKNLHAWVVTATGGTPPERPSNNPDVPPGLGGLPGGSGGGGTDDEPDGTDDPAPEITPTPPPGQDGESSNKPATPPGQSKTPKSPSGTDGNGDQANE